MSTDAFVISRYAEKPTFSSFLPGIAGARGIPVWCYYNNRGQAVCSFGISDKDHAIMEFSPAHVAYQNVERTGFRTFIRRDGETVEAFADGSAAMEIRPNELVLRWSDRSTAVEAVYFVLPESPVGALVRKVTVTSLDGGAELDVLDGMPALVPYGVSQDALKNMTQLACAWMQAEDAEQGLAFYRVRASMADTAIVTAVEGGNFALCYTEDGQRLPAVVDPEAVFGWDTALARPLGFMAGDFDRRAAAQAVSNIFPCAFFRRKARLRKGESLTLLEMYGQAETKRIFTDFAAVSRDAAWFEDRRRTADALAQRLTDVIGGRTADPAFDAYSRQSYLDNLLRGGEPIRFTHGGRQNIFYLYSRKHGDPEREYNYFVMSPEYYSQGNGNFRDVCQNRRCDVLFHPWVGDADIRLFFSLLQSDGYNPLVIDRMTFRVKDPETVLAQLPEAAREEAAALFAGDFTPGRLAMAAETWGLPDADGFVNGVLAEAEAEPNATFGEGYWSDHWTYSLDLIESYLAVWPEKKKELLTGRADYPWYETRAVILPYSRRLVETERGVRQAVFLDTDRKKNSPNRWMREEHGTGGIARSTLLEKLVVLCALKYAALDRAGIGVEMEGGKPGWYDALNGLPGLSGSSVAESCELQRTLSWTAAALEETGGELRLYTEMAELLEALSKLDGDPEARWKATCALREDYRERTADGVAGEKRTLSAEKTAAVLRDFEEHVRAGLQRAVSLGGGICPTYLMFPEGRAEVLPLFLEGPVRWLKLDASMEEKQAMADRIRESGLYDRKLGMFKVNESLSGLTFEAGRTRAFTPGWLENESIWLHMEYKYLLELLRAGLYEEFERSLDSAAVPFLDPAVYGRSIYENVSFIASSANPNPAVHGRGFVARLSGSTAEWLSIWQLMMFGPAPFAQTAEGLQLRLRPMLPGRLIPVDGAVEAMLLGQTNVRYHIDGAGSLIPGGYEITRWVADGEWIAGGSLPAGMAERIRSGEIRQLDVFIRRKTGGQPKTTGEKTE